MRNQAPCFFKKIQKMERSQIMARWKNMSKRLAVLIMMGAMMLGSATTGRLYDRIGKGKEFFPIRSENQIRRRNSMEFS